MQQSNDAIVPDRLRQHAHIAVQYGDQRPSLKVVKPPVQQNGSSSRGARASHRSARARSISPATNARIDVFAKRLRVCVLYMQLADHAVEGLRQRANSPVRRSRYDGVERALGATADDEPQTSPT